MNNTHEKIFVRPEGNKVKVRTRFFSDYRQCEYTQEVFTCEKRKRSWYSVYDTNSYTYRKLSMEERSVFINQEILKHVSIEELTACRVLLWHQLNPENL